MIFRQLLAISLGLTAAMLLCAPSALRAQEGESNAAANGAQNQASSSGSAGTVTPDTGSEVVPEPTNEGSNLGVGNFSPTRLHVSVSLREGYDDNVYATDLNPISSFFTEGSVDLGYSFGSPRTTFTLEAVVGGSYYYTRPFGQHYDVNDALSLGLEHHATARLTLSASVYLSYQSEPDFFNNQLGINRIGGNFFYTADKLNASYQWAPRFSTLTSYTLNVIHYDESVIGAYEDRFDHTFGNEFRFLVEPTTTLVAEYRYELVNYVTAPFDSTTQYVLAGVDHTFDPHFNISVRGGAEFRQFEDFGEKTSPYAEGTLHYSGAHRSSVDLTARYGLEEPDVPNIAARTTFRTGITANYGLTSRLTATGSVFYEHDDNESFETLFYFTPAFTEDLFDVGIGLRFDINRTYSLLAGYDHTEDISQVQFREYSRNQIYIGASVAF